jgi:formate hydrogenlyase subunit 3/multisubunit Na+/H+ antiporter MnhD subunit
MAKFYLLAALAVIVSIITLASFLKFQRYAFYNKSDISHNNQIKEVPFPMAFSMVVLSIICILLSLLAIPDIRHAVLTPAVNILTDHFKYTSIILGQ